VPAASRRATPLAPEARRASIIAATLPLLRRYGANVTTAQIAIAAGVAEGTLFRAFADKDALIAAAIETAFDPKPSELELARIDQALPLRDKLIAAVEILQHRVEGVWQLMMVLGRTAPPRPDPKRDVKDYHRDDGLRRAVEVLLEPHADELRYEPVQVARFLRMFAFAASHPRIADGQPLTSAEIVAVVLDGSRTRTDIEDIA
jgi:AcrR family transcriptional regulator